MSRRLSLLMFLQYATLGAILPLYSLHWQRLQFTEVEIGLVCATQATGALAALASGQFADRWFRAEHCLAVHAAAASGFLWLLASLTTPLAVLAVSLLFWMTIVPACSLGAAICFAHLDNPDRQFGPVRMWGTIGWVVGSLLSSNWVDENSGLRRLAEWLGANHSATDWGDLFRLASLVALTLAAYALTLPRTVPQRRCGPWLAPLGALRLLRGRAFAVCCCCFFGVWVTQPFSSQVTPLLLDRLGITPGWLGPILTIQQSTEIICLALLPAIVLRYGERRTMAVGLGAWALALSILTAGWPIWLVIGSQGLNGLCICCFFVASQVYANRRADADIRASVQALLSFAQGLGLLAGNLLVGYVRKLADGAFGPTFGVGACLACGLLLVFLCGFPRERSAEKRAAGALPGPEAA